MWRNSTEFCQVTASSVPETTYFGVLDGDLIGVGHGPPASLETAARVLVRPAGRLRDAVQGHARGDDQLSHAPDRHESAVTLGTGRRAELGTHVAG